MLKICYIIIIIFNFYNMACIFEPSLTFIRTVSTNLSLPFYAQFNPKPDKAGLYSLWISNNPYGSRLAECGYISQFKYNPDNIGFNFVNKISTANILGLTPCKKQDNVYPGIKSYVATSINDKYVLQASVLSQYPTYNLNILNCKKNDTINSYVLGGPPSNIQFSNFKYIFNGVKYQMLILPYIIKNNTNGEILSFVSLFNYALNKGILNQPLTPNIIISDINIYIPSDAKLSPFASTDGSYLLAVSNANSDNLSLFKVNISDFTNITATFYKSIFIGNHQQHFVAFSNDRYLAIDTIDVNQDNLYLYYFDQDFNITPLNNNIPYNTGKLPQALAWSPDAKVLIVPNYLDNSFTVYKANTCNIRVTLTPKISVQYPDGSSTLTATVFNGTPPYTFYFSNGQIITQNSNKSSIVVSPTTTTIYNVTVTDANNCITGRASPVTVQVARPVITNIVPKCARNVITIYGKIIDPHGLPVICTTIELFINKGRPEKVFVKSDKSGNFKINYKINPITSIRLILPLN